MTVHEDRGGSSPEHLPSRLRRNDARGALSQVGQLMILAWFDRRRIAVDEPRVGAVARLVDTTVIEPTRRAANARNGPDAVDVDDCN